MPTGIVRAIIRQLDGTLFGITRSSTLLREDCMGGTTRLDLAGPTTFSNT
jgi:hypothetical protein